VSVLKYTLVSLEIVKYYFLLTVTLANVKYGWKYISGLEEFKKKQEPN